MKSFGVAPRESYNSDSFYARSLYGGEKRPEEIVYRENPLPVELLDTVICQDSRNMSQLPDCSVHLVVTSLLIMFRARR
jgi:site-specific DNA-methyltransferase (adenine-specific)